MKKRKLQVSDATGRIIEKEIPSHFETADELIALIHEALSLETFKGYHDEGLIIVDNLEAVSIDDRRKIKHFIEAQTPPEMQFLLTSRNSEEYESNTRLCGFESEDGKTFVHSYIEENALDVRLEDSEINELLDIAKGNTLVLALSFLCNMIHEANVVLINVRKFILLFLGFQHGNIKSQHFSLRVC